MPGWTKLAEVNLVPLQAAVFCAECERISDSYSSYCAGCGSRALLHLSRVLGGSLRGQNTARLIADAELDRLVREVISTVPDPVASERNLPTPRISVRHHLRTNELQGELELAYPPLEEEDLGELDLEPTISLIAERAQIVTAATGAAVALRRGGDIVCRARAGRTAPDLGVRLQTDSGLSAECVRTGEVLLCGDAEASPRVDLDSCRRLGVRSILVAPLRYFRRTLGLFEVLSSTPYAFDYQDVASMQMLAGLTVAAISRRAGHVAGMPPA
jgi:GAF domain-containing protein